MKILFVVPEVKSMFGTEKGIPIHPHVGIAYLTSVLKKNHHQVQIVDCGIKKNHFKQSKKPLNNFNLI